MTGTVQGRANPMRTNNAPVPNTQIQTCVLNSMISAQLSNDSDSETGEITGSVEIQIVSKVLKVQIVAARNATRNNLLANLWSQGVNAAAMRDGRIAASNCC